MVADPSVGVRDIANCITTWVTTSMNTDLFLLLKPPEGLVMSWKSSPQAEWLSKVSSLFVLLAQICPNTVLTSKKVMAAIKSLREGNTITSSCHKKGEDFDDWCDQAVRIVFAQFREVKRNPLALARVQKRCSSEQWNNISCVLEKIKVPENAKVFEDGVATSKTAPAVPAIPSSWGPLVIHPSSAKSADSFSIFRKIIAAPTEEPAKATGPADAISSLSPASSAAASSTPALPPPATLQQPSSALANAQSCNSPVCSKKWKMMEPPTPSDNLNPEDQAMLMNCLAAKPKPKAKSKRATKKAEEENTESGNAVSSKQMKATKGSKTLERAQAKKDAKRKKANQEKQEEDWPPASEKVKRHRFVSQAYHKEFDSVYKASNDKVKAKEAGRIAYQKAAEEWKAKHSQ